MEVFYRRTEVLRMETHIIAREQHGRAIERGVFDRLGGNRGGQLLEAYAGIL